MILEGTWVRLEPLGERHVDDLVAAASEDRSTFGWTTVPDGEAAVLDYVRELAEARDAGDVVPFAQVRCADGRAVGATRLLHLRGWAVEIGGTWLGAAAQRTPINTEAKLLLLTHAFDERGCGRVDFATDARNERSRAAIEAIGATYEATLRSWQPSHAAGEDGLLRDTAMFSIVAAEWPAVRAGLGERLAR